jgi:hypothetical protein
MESIFEATADRRSNERRRVGFSWTSFYAGVVVAMGMMLIAYHLLPRGGVAGLAPGKGPAAAVVPATKEAAQEQAVDARRLRNYEKHLSAALLASTIEAASPDAEGDSVALERLRSRGNAPLNAFDREDAVAALIDRTGKTRDEAQIMVDAWINRGNRFDPLASARPEPINEDGDRASPANDRRW